MMFNVGRGNPTLAAHLHVRIGFIKPMRRYVCRPVAVSCALVLRGVLSCDVSPTVRCVPAALPRVRALAPDGKLRVCQSIQQRTTFMRLRWQSLPPLPGLRQVVLHGNCVDLLARPCAVCVLQLHCILYMSCVALATGAAGQCASPGFTGATPIYSASALTGGCTPISCAAAGYTGPSGDCACTAGFKGTVVYVSGAPTCCSGCMTVRLRGTDQIQ